MGFGSDKIVGDPLKLVLGADVAVTVERGESLALASSDTTQVVICRVKPA